MPFWNGSNASRKSCPGGCLTERPSTDAKLYVPALLPAGAAPRRDPEPGDGSAGQSLRAFHPERADSNGWEHTRAAEKQGRIRRHMVGMLSILMACSPAGAPSGIERYRRQRWTPRRNTLDLRPAPLTAEPDRRLMGLFGSARGSTARPNAENASPVYRKTKTTHHAISR